MRKNTFEEGTVCFEGITGFQSCSQEGVNKQWKDSDKGQKRALFL